MQNAVDGGAIPGHNRRAPSEVRFETQYRLPVNTPSNRPGGILQGILAAAALGILLPRAQAQTYAATQLPTLGGTQGSALAINGAGTIAGDATLLGDTATHAITITNGVTVDLGTLGGTNSYANGINGFGNVVGNSTLAGDATTHAFRSTYGIIADLGTLGGTQSFALGINTTGTIIGFATLAGDVVTHAFSFNSATATMTDLGTLGGVNSRAYAINTSGTIVGNEEPSVGSSNHLAFSFSNGLMTDLGALGGVKSTALGINDAGTIVGDAQTSAGAIHAFSYSGGVMTDLGTLGSAALASFAYAVNSSGVIVGYSAVTAGGNDAFVTVNGQMTDLNSLVTLAGVTLTGATGINDLGQITANGSDGRAYLLTPLSVHFSVSAPASVNQGAPLSVTVTAIDGSGNVAATYGGLVKLTSSDGAAVLPAVGPLTSGTATFQVKLSTVGTQTVTATDTVIGTIKGTSAAISVNRVIAPAMSVQPLPETVNFGANAAFWAVASGTGPLSYQWNFNGAPIPGATSQLLQDVGAVASSAGTYSVTISNTSGSVTSAAVALTVNSASGNPLKFSSQPLSQTAAGASTVVLSATTGAVAGEPAAVYQWFLNGAVLPGANDPVYVIGGASAANSGNYSCVAVGSLGAILSNTATLNVVGGLSPGRLVNLSCRAAVGAGASQLIAGFVVGGQGASGSEPVLIRASGPALAPFGVTGVLADPQLTLTGAAGVVATNSAWGGSAAVASTAASVGAFAWTAASSHDSALVESLAGGGYTAQISGSSGDAGVALAEVYDATPAAGRTTASPRLVNISARAQVGTGGNILVAGFVIGGTASRTVLIRGSGPALAPFGVSGVLSDPQLQLYQGNADGSSTLLASDSGWGGDGPIASAAASVGAFSWGLFATGDSAILMTLPPGSYTAQVSGAKGDTGVALVEVYEVP
jgi:probable HAF family extracellular repeat protein